MMDRLELHLLGSPEVRLNDQSLILKERKVLALLVYLAVTNEPHQRETLATLFWPEQTAKRGRTHLRRALWLLKQALGEGWLETDGDEIRLSQQAEVWLDVAHFKGLTAQEAASAATPPPLDRLEEAIALYRGDFLTGFTLPDSSAFDEWQFFEAETTRQAMVSALDDLVRHYTQAAAYEAALGHARRRLVLDPLHEPAHQTLMRLYAFSGRQAAALRQFEECRRILETELGLEPDAETIALAAAIREKRLTPPAPPEQRPPITVSPHPQAGLDEVESLQSPLAERPLFVGREPELAQLENALTKALAGQGQLRLITGEAGAGKSALVTEFSHRIASPQADLLITVGSCDPQSGPLDPYLPFREALMWLLKGGETKASTLSPPNLTAPQARRMRTITSQALLAHGPHLLSLFVPFSERDHIIAPGQPTGWPGEQPQTTVGEQTLEQSRIFSEVVAVLQRVAAQMPLILVLEDLHWVDNGSLGLLSQLVRQSAGSRLLVIGTYRSEAVSLGRQGEAHPLEQMVREVQRHLGDIYIDLEAARQREGITLVDGVLDAEPNRLNASFRQALHDQTSGHPLFVVELVQDLKKRGALVQDKGGTWQMGAKLDWQNLPARIEGAIAGRMTHLSEEQRWLLTIACVVGEHFPLEVVAYVAGVEPGQLGQTLSRILQRQHQLVAAEGVERLGEGRLTHYRFRHNLIQVYLYEQLDEVQRIYLHEDVARTLEMLYGPEVESMAVQLARHYETAGVMQKAIAYLILAGEQVMRLSAYDEATQHFKQALTLLAALPDSLECQQQAFTAQFNLGKVGEAINGIGSQEAEAAYSHALALGRQLGESRQITQVLLALTYQAQYRSESEVAQAYGEEALRLAKEIQDPELMMLANQSMGVIAMGLGQNDKVVTYSDQVLTFYHRHSSLTSDDVYNLVWTLGVSGYSLVPAGYPDRALRQAQEGMALVQQPEHHFNTTSALGWLAAIHIRRSDWQEGLRVGEAMRDLSETYNFFLRRTFGEMHIGVALAMLGEVDTGIGLVRQAFADRATMGANIAQAGYIAYLGKACGQAGRVAEGLDLVNEALTEMEASNDRQNEPKIHQIKGDLLLLQKLSTTEQASVQQEAEVYFRRAIEVAKYQQAKLWEARALASLCRLLHSQGRDEGCRQQLADLHAWFIEGFETEDLQVVQTVLHEIA